MVMISWNVNSQEADKMEWRKEESFGRFIHWVVYSVYGNIYNGLGVNEKLVNCNYIGKGSVKWIMYGACIPRSIYKESAKELDANTGYEYILYTPVL